MIAIIASFSSACLGWRFIGLLNRDNKYAASGIPGPPYSVTWTSSHNCAAMLENLRYPPDSHYRACHCGLRAFRITHRTSDVQPAESRRPSNATQKGAPPPGHRPVPDALVLGNGGPGGR